MARIRTIKPDFWTNPKVVSVPPVTRLMFIGMWNYADDYGRLAYEPLSLKLKLFPNDPGISQADVRDMINDLCANDLIIIYSSNDKEYIEITGWDHQKIDKRQASKLPAPFDSDSDIRRLPPTPADLPRTLPTPDPVREGKGKEGKVEEKNLSDACASKPDPFDEFWKLYPRRDGANPKEPARRQFVMAVKAGAHPQDIIAGVKRCRQVEAKNIGTPYIPQAIKWLRDQRWNDYPEKPGGDDGDGLLEVLDQLALEAWDAYGLKQNGRAYPRNRKGGWRFPSKYPPDYGESQLRGVQDIIAKASA